MLCNNTEISTAQLLKSHTAAGQSSDSQNPE